MRKALLVSAVLLFAGCASKPPPTWQADAHGSLERYSAAYLAGEARVAQAEFTRARSGLASAGRADLVARAELVRCAAAVASLEFGDCPGFEAMRADAPLDEQAYAAWLSGKASADDIARLPVHHRAVALGNADALPEIEDPFARLVAAGVLMRTNRATPGSIVLAADTASTQGWRRPLLAWLGVQKQRAEQAGDRRRPRPWAGEVI
ncbi:MAG: hypothetical protein IPJ28_06420 [Betaproteobacteria bacterium]|nr:hypothetical protein [Betaproteobacteria bacterium]